jgi:hypothetical protein
MDPDVNLEAQLDLARAALDRMAMDEDDALQLAELVVSLDEWLVRGGYAPARWRPSPAAAHAARVRCEATTHALGRCSRQGHHVVAGRRYCAQHVGVGRALAMGATP